VAMGGRIKNNERPKRLPLPIIGRIKCGLKSDRGYPMSTDYFVATGKYSRLFDEAYGAKPDVIQIVFPSDDADMVCREEYEFRDEAGKLVASGDGETFKVWSTKTSTYAVFTTEQYPDIMDMVSSRHPKCQWKVTLTLNFIIPKIRGVMGVWQFQTKGVASTIPQIRDYFDEFYEQQGKVSGVIFDLSVIMAKSQKPGQSSKYPVVSLIANESRENLEMAQECRKPIMIGE